MTNTGTLSPPRPQVARGGRQVEAPRDPGAPDAPPAPRGREHPDHARGGRRVRQARDALFDRQGQRGDAAPRAQGVLPGAAAVPAAARRHARGSSRRCTSCASEITRKYNLQLIVYTNPDGVEQGINPFTHGSAIHTDVMKTAGRSSRRSTSTASTPRSAAAAATRKRAAPRSASSRSAARSTAGTRRTSAPSSGRSTTRASTRARASACSRCRTGPSSTSGSTST